ncbi:hypothetical protein F2P81_004743 [Scophthalmus maximus]|uniref:Small EDRK-rich factor-like N-terminal domain-containing protein n=1 Tax=Scophthalmus maximus TaxID=52904 RepID=A0A6A4T746_SCOMX|nr:hypothetical protein F2P81_004743 [Scophthalmus maximus]
MRQTAVEETLPPPVLLFWSLPRGNQRELARQKNAKKATDHGKGKRGDDGLSAAARKQRDAEIMQQKQKKANDPGKESQSTRYLGLSHFIDSSWDLQVNAEEQHVMDID